MGLLEGKPQAPQEQPSADELDVQIAAGAAAKMMSTPQAVKVLSDAFQGPNAARTAGMFIAQLVERIQEMSEDSDIPLNPSVWFMEGGALDEIGDELSDIAESVGVEFTQSTMDEIKAVVMEIGQQRMTQEDAPQGEQEQPQQQEPQPPSGLIGGM